MQKVQTAWTQNFLFMQKQNKKNNCFLLDILEMTLNAVSVGSNELHLSTFFSWEPPINIKKRLFGNDTIGESTIKNENP